MRGFSASAGIAALTFTLAACASGGDSDVVSVDDVARVTQQADTARLEGSSKPRGDATQVVHGEVDLAQNNYHFTVDVGDGSIVELIVIGDKGYFRGTAEFTSPEWCSEEHVEGPAFEFGSVLESLSGEEGELERLGTEE